jgi:tetratricopeptide (TPR) repeat protein
MKHRGSRLLSLAVLVLGCAHKQPFEQAVGLDVSVESLPPGAMISEGEKPLGTTPTNVDLQDPNVDHILVIQKDGYRPAEVTLRGADIRNGGAVQVALAPEGTKAETISFDDAETLLAAGQSVLAKGNPADAEQFFRRVIVLKPANGPAYKGLGIALGNLGKKKEALDAYREYLLYAPDASDAKRIQEIVNKGSAGIDIPPPKEERGF